MARIRGGSLGGAARLFYHAGLKPSLVYRKWTSFDAERVVQVPLALGRNKKWTVSVRDNELDMRTLTEFFCQNAGVTKEIPEREPAVIYDIGANIGISSLLFASRYPHARIYGFEPLPSNYRMCSMNYQNLEHAQAFPWAIGAASGVTAFEFEVNDNRGGRLATSAMGNSPTNTQRITVDVVSIADLIEKKRFAPPEFVKIDVEGAEMNVLGGIGGHVGSIKAMHVETHGPEIRAECLQWLRQNGFAILGEREEFPGYGSVWSVRR